MNLLHRLRRLSLFVGSMNLAITLFVTLAIASVIGTVLQQNQPFQSYIVKFGPFWHELYRALGLYDVYSSIGFVAILAFLVISTGVCILRNGPRILHGVARLQVHTQEAALRNAANSRVVDSPLDPAQAGAGVVSLFRDEGYRVRVEQGAGTVCVAAVRGSANRIGYLFTHTAIVIICLGGLADGNLPLKWRTLTGDVQTETRDLPIAQIPEASRLPADNHSFRASVSIPEGVAVDYAFINLSSGYLLQELPFTIHVRDFRIEHYFTGQPKSFESDLEIRDPATGDVTQQTIAVNHPLNYRGYTVFQASFGDGGTKLNLRLAPLAGMATSPRTLEARIGETREVQTPHGPRRLELDDFRRFNIFPVEEDEETEDRFRDYGPSVTYKLRAPDGSAKEYVTYMFPVTLDGRELLISGVRSSVEEEFRYLHLPVDADGGASRFFRFAALLHDDAAIERILDEPGAVPGASEAADVMDQQVRRAMLRLVQVFREGGFDALEEHIATRVPEAERDAAGAAYVKVLQHALLRIYLHMLDEEGAGAPAEDAGQFLNEASLALSGMPRYDAPFFLRIEDFTERQATGLQITRTPGRVWVYFGFCLLVAGVFLLFYVAHQRIWAIVSGGPSGSRVTVAGTRNRHMRDFAPYFAGLAARIAAATGVRPGERSGRPPRQE